MNRMMFFFIVVVMMVVSSSAARAQYSRSRAAFTLTDSTRLRLDRQLGARGAVSASNSNTILEYSIFGAVSGAVIGAVVGFVVSERVSPAPTCRDCGVNGSHQNRVPITGTAIGAVSGAVIGWFAGRRL
jgi:uncharacterized protein YcfJ